MQRLLLPALLVGTFMGFLDLFIVTVALPPIRADLHTSVAAGQLVLAVYVVAYGVALVTGGRLGDRFGRKRLFVGGMAAFTASSLLCALAPTVAALVAARAAQGLSAGAMLPQVLATIQVAVPEERRAAAIGAYGAVIGAAAVSGQVLGGLLVQVDVLGLGWRALFAINLPIGIAGVLLARRVLPATRADDPQPLDLAGVAAISLALVVLLAGLTEGPDRHWPAWTVLAVLAGLALAAGAAAVERGVERRGRAALVPPRLVARRPVRIGLLLILAFYASNTGFFVVLTFFLQEGLHASPLTAGLTFAPIGVGFSLASARGGAGMRAGALIMVAGLAATIGLARAGIGAMAPALLVCGIGQGLVAPPLIGTVLKRVDPRDAGAASGVLLTATQVANALGIAILGGAWTAAAGLGARNAFAVGTGGALVLAALAWAAARLLATVEEPCPPTSTPSTHRRRTSAPSSAPSGASSATATASTPSSPTA